MEEQRRFKKEYRGFRRLIALIADPLVITTRSVLVLDKSITEKSIWLRRASNLVLFFGAWYGLIEITYILVKYEKLLPSYVIWDDGPGTRHQFLGAPPRFIFTQLYVKNLLPAVGMITSAFVLRAFSYEKKGETGNQIQPQ